MLQRIQSVFLFLALLLLGLIFVLPFAKMVDAQGGEVVLTCVDFPLVLFQLTTFAFTFFTLLLYKNRRRQIFFCRVNIWLLLIYMLALCWQLHSISQTVEVAQIKVASIVPVLAAIFTWLAKRGIAKDEALIKSLDRLR
jgi:hypothetical protein